MFIWSLILWFNYVYIFENVLAISLNRSISYLGESDVSTKIGIFYNGKSSRSMLIFSVFGYSTKIKAMFGSQKVLKKEKKELKEKDIFTFGYCGKR